MGLNLDFIMKGLGSERGEFLLRYEEYSSDNGREVWLIREVRMGKMTIREAKSLYQIEKEALSDPSQFRCVELLKVVPVY